MNKEQIEQKAWQEYPEADRARWDAIHVNIDRKFKRDAFIEGALFMQAENERLKGLLEGVYKDLAEHKYNSSVDPNAKWLQFAKENNIE